MPYSRAELSATERARYALDLPIVASGHVLTAAARVAWRPGGSWASGADVSERTAPARCAIDGDAHVPTRAASNGIGTAMYLLIDAGTGIAFDAAVVRGHNGADLGGSVSFQLQIADDEAYTSNLETLATWTSTLTRRLVSVTLGAGNVGVLVGARYSNVRYVRLRVAYDGAAPHPELTELYLLSRYALPRRPDTPHDDGAVESLTHALAVESGDEYAVSRYRDRHVLDATWEIDSTADLAAWRAWHVAADYGAEPIVYLPRPLTDVRRAYVMRQRDPALSIPVRAGVSNAIVRLAAIEQAPFVGAEVNG